MLTFSPLWLVPYLFQSLRILNITTLCILKKKEKLLKNNNDAHNKTTHHPQNYQNYSLEL